MQQYIGKIVQLIYVDSKKNVSIRNIRILMVGKERFMAFCYQANEVRSFRKTGVVDIEVLTPRMIEVLNSAERHSEKSKANTI